MKETKTTLESEKYEKLKHDILSTVVPTLPTTITATASKEPISVSFTVDDILATVYEAYDEVVNRNYVIYTSLWFQDGNRKRSYPIIFTYRPYTNSLKDILSYTSQEFTNAMTFFNNEIDYTWWVQHYDECHPEQVNSEEGA